MPKGRVQAKEQTGPPDRASGDRDGEKKSNEESR